MMIHVKSLINRISLGSNCIRNSEYAAYSMTRKKSFEPNEMKSSKKSRVKYFCDACWWHINDVGDMTVIIIILNFN